MTAILDSYFFVKKVSIETQPYKNLLIKDERNFNIEAKFVLAFIFKCM